MCVTVECLVSTPGGARAAGTLGAGDLVSTVDGAVVQLTWCGVSRFPWADQMGSAFRRPIRIAKGALGPGVPERAMLVSPDQTVLCDGGPARRFDGAAVLLPALALTALPGVRHMPALPGLGYVHLLCGRREVLRIDGVAMGSLLPGRASANVMVQAQRRALTDVLPDEGAYGIGSELPLLSLRKAETMVARCQRAGRPIQTLDRPGAAQESGTA